MKNSKHEYDCNMRIFPPKETDAGKTSDEEAAEGDLCDKNADAVGAEC